MSTSQSLRNDAINEDDHILSSNTVRAYANEHGISLFQAKQSLKKKQMMEDAINARDLQSINQLLIKIVKEI